MDKYRIEILAQLKQYGETESIPNISEINGKFLNFLIKQGKYKNGIEVGAANGYSTIWLGEAFESNEGKLLSFEIQDISYKQAEENILKAKLNNTVIIKKGNFLEEFLLEKPRYIDFAFIDGKKAEYLMYLKLITPFLLKNSLIVLDDVIKFKNKMINLYEYLDSQNDFDYFVLPLDDDKNKKDGIMILTKK